MAQQWAGGASWSVVNNAMAGPVCPGSSSRPVFRHWNCDREEGSRRDAGGFIADLHTSRYTLPPSGVHAHDSKPGEAGAGIKCLNECKTPATCWQVFSQCIYNSSISIYSVLFWGCCLFEQPQTYPLRISDGKVCLINRRSSFWVLFSFFLSVIVVFFGKKPDLEVFVVDY